MADNFYPPNYTKADQLQTYVETKVEMIAEIVEATEKTLDSKSFQYFMSELGDYLNEV